MSPRPTTIGVALVLVFSGALASAQSHAAPTVVPAKAPAVPAGGSHAEAPRPTPPSAATTAAPHAASSPVAAAPHGAATASPPRATPVKLGEIRGRINAALAAMPALTVRPRRGVTPAAAAPRYEVRWPQDRWQVQWPVVAERLTLAWPQ